jgi:hypothetical protein
VSTVDWALAAAVLYALLPPGAIAFHAVLSAFLAAQILGLVSHVPGGLGVFESAMVVLLRTDLSASVLLPALVLYRLIYYVAPLALAMVVLGADELLQRRERFRRMRALFGSVAQEITPRLLAVFTFLAGAVLLFSGATPAAAGRLALLHRLLPLGVIEASHFLGSLVGAGLLIVSQGLARRLDAAFYLATGGLVLGIALSLLKGGNYEEAGVLGLILAALLESRPRFDRRAAFFATRFSPAWTAAVLGVVAASVWLGLFAFQHVQYSSELWWEFELKKEAARSLRAGVGVALSVLVFAALRLMRPAPPEVALPSSEDLARAARIIESQHSTLPYLVYLRDKAVLFDAEQSAFVMYAVQARTWVALGDPVGPPPSSAPSWSAATTSGAAPSSMKWAASGSTSTRISASPSSRWAKRRRWISSASRSTDTRTSRCVWPRGDWRTRAPPSASPRRRRSAPSSPLCARSRTSGSPRSAWPRRGSRSGTSTPTTSDASRPLSSSTAAASRPSPTYGRARAASSCPSTSCATAALRPKASWMRCSCT